MYKQVGVFTRLHVCVNCKLTQRAKRRESETAGIIIEWLV